MKVTVSLLIKGKVQGVYYRQSTKKEALRLGITGEVSNQRDGTVLVIACGEKTLIDEFIEWCKKGPAMARVESVTVNDMERNTSAGLVSLTIKSLRIFRVLA